MSRLALEPGQRVGDRLVVGVLHRLPGAGGSQRPEQGGALHRGEDQVVAGHGAAVLASWASIFERTTGDGAHRSRAPTPRAEQRPGRIVRAAACTAGTRGRASPPGRRSPGWRRPRPRALGVGVQTPTEQGPHLVLADPSCDRQVGGSGAEPPSGWVARGGVVIGELLAGGPALVPCGDLPGEVGIAVARLRAALRAVLGSNPAAGVVSCPLRAMSSRTLVPPSDSCRVCLSG